MLHTYAVLEVPRTVYAAVRALLAVAGYDHVFHDEGTPSEVIDMHGIALQSKGGQPTTDITISTLVSRRDGRGRVDFQLNGDMTQMDLDKAREVNRTLSEAIEAAVSDELLVRFLTENIGLEPDKANAALIDFREMRQGSRDRVHPS